eukprot:GFYU01000909.1.p1 GENE.GFYU01000909.1~~GFYU01000909.1.p1  ORF type:complete len:262 (+),score=76.05 GFYU01000909.1:224-1009(+)
MRPESAPAGLYSGGAESIYNLIPPEEYHPPRPPRYRSQFAQSVKSEAPSVYSSFKGSKKSAGTFGPSKVPLRHPRQFLRSHEREPTLPEIKPFAYAISGLAKKPPVPRRHEKPLMGFVTTKNFITANAVENILAVPKKRPEEKILYRNKPDYGQVPSYLENVKDEIQAEYEYIKGMQAWEAEEDEGDRMYKLEEGDQVSLVKALKRKWHEIMIKYQRLPAILESQNQKDYKEHLEATLNDLEKSIEKLSKRNVFVTSDEFY